MSFYDETDIPLFYDLAKNYLVCDRWFAAHPGGIYPNRWALLSGTMPHLNNFPPRQPANGVPKNSDDLRPSDEPDPNLNIEWVY